MVNQRNQLRHAPEWRVERNLVQILDHNVVLVRRQLGRVITVSEKRIGLTRPDPMNVDSIEIHSRRRILPGAAKKIPLVPARDDATEDFLEVKLGAPRLWILVILPVEYEYAH